MRESASISIFYKFREGKTIGEFPAQRRSYIGEKEKAEYVRENEPEGSGESFCIGLESGDENSRCPYPADRNRERPLKGGNITARDEKFLDRRTCIFPSVPEGYGNHRNREAEKE